MMYEKMAGKKLIKVLDMIENDTIKVCTEYGTNFWYVGSKEKFIKNITKLSKALKKRFRATYEVMEFVPLRQRRVIEVFDASPSVDESTVIYITGNEIGNMWFVGEKPKIEDGEDLLNPEVVPEFLKKRGRGRRRRK